MKGKLIAAGIVTGVAVALAVVVAIGPDVGPYWPLSKWITPPILATSEPPMPVLGLEPLGDVYLSTNTVYRFYDPQTKVICYFYRQSISCVAVDLLKDK